MKVAITDYTFPSLEVEEAILRSEGHELVSFKEKRPATDLMGLLGDADAVITQFAPLTAEVIASMRKAKVIVRYGIGVDNVDLTAARAHGIPVCNIPDYCVDEVADHTLALILALTRQVVPNHSLIKDGKWGLATPLDHLYKLRDLTVGIVGFGRIGREVAARLAAFKPRILVHDPVVDPAAIEATGAIPSELNSLMKRSEIITLHCPSNAATRGMIDRSALAQMPQGSLLINVARGDLIESEALVEALRSGQIAGAALDVFNPEPIPPDHPIRSFPNVVFSSHIASASVPAVRTLRETAARIAASVLRGESPPNVVN